MHEDVNFASFRFERDALKVTHGGIHVLLSSVLVYGTNGMAPLRDVP